MRLVARCLVLAVAVFAASAPARAQSDWPSRPITSIGPLAAGGGADIALRALASFVKDHLGQPFVATNKPGGGSTAAALEMLSKPADGYTVASLLSNGAAPEVYRYFAEVPYTGRDIVPVIRIVSFPFALYVHTSSPWKTLDEFVKEAKAKPGKLSYGHTGRGIQLHLAVAALADAAGIELREVPTKGASEVFQILLGRHIDAGVGSVTAGKKFVDAGSFRPLAVHADTRVTAFPDTPTFKELGYDFGFPTIYLTMFVKAGTPPEIVRKLHDGVKTTLEDPRFIEIAEKAEITIHYGGQEEIRKDLQAEYDVVAPLLKKLGMYKD